MLHSFHCLIQNLKCGGICDHLINFFQFVLHFILKKILLRKFKCCLTNIFTSYMQSSQHGYCICKYKRSIKISSFIATIYLKGLLIRKGLVATLIHVNQCLTVSCDYLHCKSFFDWLARGYKKLLDDVQITCIGMVMYR